MKKGSTNETLDFAALNVKIWTNSEFSVALTNTKEKKSNFLQWLNDIHVLHFDSVSFVVK